MNDWARKPSVEDFQTLREIASSFREAWRAIRPPFPAGFEGEFEDVLALDYMDYEFLPYPEGLETAHAAMLCGEVLRKVTDLVWLVNATGEWILARPEELDPRFAICPSARLHEAGGSDPSLDERYLTFVQRTAMEYVVVVQPEDVQGLQTFFQPPCGGERLSRVPSQLARLLGHTS